MTLHLPEFQIDASSDETLKIGTQKIMKLIRPNWSCGDIRFKIYSGGLINKLIGVWSELNEDDQILVRVNGERTDLILDRHMEAENMKFLHIHGCGPQLYVVFQNGLCYSFTPGIPLTPESPFKLVAAREPKIWKAIATQMAKMHSLKIDGQEAALFPKIKSFIQLLPESFFCFDHNMRLAVAGISKQYIKEEAKVMETALTALNCPIVFCHNDPNLSNIIWNADSGAANFIDFEFGAANYQAYDIANFFNGFAGIKDSDFSLYPKPEFQREWLQYYLTHFYDYDKCCITFEEIEKWRGWVDKFFLVLHIFWGTWSLLQVQAIHSSVDFDFIGYSISHFQDYKKRKNEFLAS